MNDTTPSIEKMVFDRLMSRSGEERFIMGSLMFDAAREMVLASFPQDLSEKEVRSRLFSRLYGNCP